MDGPSTEKKGGGREGAVAEFSLCILVRQKKSLGVCVCVCVCVRVRVCVIRALCLFFPAARKKSRSEKDAGFSELPVRFPEVLRPQAAPEVRQSRLGE